MVSAEELRQEIERRISDLSGGFLTTSKSDIRNLHSPAVQNELAKGQKWIRRKVKKYSHFFANGSEISPNDIDPQLIQVVDGWQEDLFRLARYTWSLPYTKGYGRRLRFLVVDRYNQKLMGVFGLQSPPLDFPSRDRLFNYPEGKKVELVNQTMDIFTMGAIPPYNKLLTGKLVALAVASNEVRNAYHEKYQDSITEISKQILPGRLVALTTTSAFGRSSIYNRLKYEKRLIGQSIGFTEGYGSFHLATVYPLIREYLEEQGISTKGGFGVGPRIVWQTVIRAQKQLGLPKTLLKHGLKREVFLYPLISNLTQFMEGHNDIPIYYDQPFLALASWWKDSASIFL